MPSFIFFLFATCLPAVWLVDQKALDEFVKLSDPYYSYTVLKKTSPPLMRSIDTINLTSQKWMNESQVDKPVWSHTLTIAVPATKFLRKSCLLIIRPDKSEEPSTSETLYRGLLFGTAGQFSSAVAFLKVYPSQPLTFHDHPLGRKNTTGYDIVAYSWWKFMNDPTAPPHWLVQFPMVKATVRAMDTIIDHMKKEYRREIKNFTVTGISMGGWISWLTAAVDKRVEAIVPIKMDFLNFTKSFHHQYRAYCGWSYKLRPLHEMNITQGLDTPRFIEMASHVDPLAYNERYKNVSKYIIVLSWDELFPPDNSRYYFSQLEGVKYRRIITKIDYTGNFAELFADNMVVFYNRMTEKKYGLPRIDWEIKMSNTSATIIVRTNNVYQVFSYHADTVGNMRRDFRTSILAGKSLRGNPVKWIQTQVGKVESGVFKAEMQNPEEGWRAFYVEVTYPQEVAKSHLIVTSEMLVLPDTFPCSDCSGKECRGTLV